MGIMQMKKLFLLLLIVTNCYAEPFAYEKPLICDNTVDIFSMLEKEYNEKIIFSGNPDGATEKGSVIVVTENSQTGTWTIVQFNSKFACVIAIGKNEKS